MRKAWNKIEFSPVMDAFLISNYQTMNNHELAKQLGLNLTTVRTRLYSLGYKRMEMEYWSPLQVEVLQAFYKTIGDTELAEMFNNLFPKAKGWSKKHIEKKRRYLNLKRTALEIKLIHRKNTKDGRFSVNHWKRWFGRERKAGETAVWKSGGYAFVVQKQEDGSYRKLSHVNYEKAYGAIPEGYNVIHLDGNSMNCESENLRAVSNEENARINTIVASVGLSDNYVAGMMTQLQPELRALIKQDPDLIALKRTQLILNRQIYEQGIE